MQDLLPRGAHYRPSIPHEDNTKRRCGNTATLYYRFNFIETLAKKKNVPELLTFGFIKAEVILIRLRSCGMWYGTVLYIGTNISEETDGSNFRVEELVHGYQRTEQSYLSVFRVILEVLPQMKEDEDGRSRFLWRVGVNPPNYNSIMMVEDQFLYSEDGKCSPKYCVTNDTASYLKR
jgi:hypothetical protein